jgi:hypothetical protein
MLKTCPLASISTAQLYFFPQGTQSQPTRCFWLPQYAEARVLFQKYVEDVNHLYHFVHVPSMLSVLDEVYTSLQQHGQVKVGQVILIFGVFGAATHSWVSADSDRGLFASAAEANEQSHAWTQATVELFDLSHRSTDISIEGVQGIIMNGLIIGTSEGFSRRCRSLFHEAIWVARELGLHRVDHPSNAASANTLQAEIGRRVWWYLCATDW